MNIIENSKNQIENWSLTASPIKIKHTFSNETQNLEIKSINFINEHSGLILITGYPAKKASIFYFNCSNRSTPIFEE